MLGLKTHAFLEVLARKGTHGTNATDVAKSLIEQGIRDAIKEGFLTAEDHPGKTLIAAIHIAKGERPLSVPLWKRKRPPGEERQARGSLSQPVRCK
jgi:hypothetical protein